MIKTQQLLTVNEKHYRNNQEHAEPHICRYEGGTETVTGTRGRTSCGTEAKQKTDWPHHLSSSTSSLWRGSPSKRTRGPGSESLDSADRLKAEFSAFLRHVNKPEKALWTLRIKIAIIYLFGSTYNVFLLHEKISSYISFSSIW